MTTEEKQANLRLIAAAPELLAALEDLVSASPSTFDNRHELSAAADAIRLAKGQA